MEKRFNDYREIEARFSGTSTTCGRQVGGHNIEKGDRIGYAGKGAVMCAECWAKWCREIDANSLTGEW